MIDGMVLVCLRNDLGKYHISEVMSDYSFCVARLSECIVEKENSVKVVIETLCVANYDGKMIDCEGKIMCYFEKLLKVCRWNMVMSWLLSLSRKLFLRH